MTLLSKMQVNYEIYIALAEQRAEQEGKRLKYEVYTAHELPKIKRHAVGMTDGPAPADPKGDALNSKAGREKHFPLGPAKAALETKLEAAAPLSVASTGEPGVSPKSTVCAAR